MLQLSLALDALHEPLAFWIHYNDPQAKRELLKRYEALPTRQRVALEQAVERVFPGPTLTAYRRTKPNQEMGGMSVSTDRPTYMTAFETFELRPEDVLLHWAVTYPNGEATALGGKAFGHEHEVILRPGARPRRLGGEISINVAETSTDGKWDRSTDVPRWIQSHDTLVVDALRSWKGSTSEMLIHIEDEITGAPVPLSGSGKKMRAQAAALLWELSHKSKSSPPLYRGSHQKPKDLEPWTSVRRTAEKWAAKNHGQVFELPAGTKGLRIADYLGSDPEREWIVWSGDSEMHLTHESIESTSLESFLTSTDARYPQAGDHVDSLLVREHIPNLDSIDGYFAEQEELPGVRVVPMADFGNPRSVFYASNDFERSERLAELIGRSKEINPLIVGVDEKGPFIIEGAHRFVALWYLKAKEFPAVVVVGRD